jgi:acyl-CoA synthetase (NDP forming)/GNAT superfamily N-acetyltransferase
VVLNHPADGPAAGERVILRDGSVASMREVRTSDAEALMALHDSVSAENLQLRFLSASKAGIRRYVQRLARPIADDHVSLIVEQADRILGVGVFERVPPPQRSAQSSRLTDVERAEVAFLVADDQHGRGVATLLFERLAEVARTRGISEFVADMLSHNTAMLQVATDLGYPARSVTDHEVTEMVVDLLADEQFLVASELRLQSAGRASLQPLLRPRGVAVVGASDQTSKVGGATLANIIRGGYTGPIYPISPDKSLVQGLPAFPSLRALPGPVDLVVFAVPAATVAALMAECRAAGARAVIVLSAGFADAGPAGLALQQELLETARRVGVRVVGPNCLGMTTWTADGSLAATFAPHLPARGGVGIMTQSGGLGIALLEHVRQAGIGVSTFLSVGNKVDVSGNDLLAWWAGDETTEVAVLYLESFGNPRRFARLARQLSRLKPVVVVKAGSSAVGSRAAQSHTAAGASPRRSVAALLRQAGVIQVEHIGELIETLTLLAIAPPPPGNQMAVLSNAGGLGILAADAGAAYGLQVADLPEDVRAELRRLLPASASTNNPVDTTPAAAIDSFVRAALLLASDPAVDALLVALTPTPLIDISVLERELAAAPLPKDKPTVLVVVGSGETVRTTNGAVHDGRPRLPVYAFPEAAVRSLARAAEYAAFRRRPEPARPVFSDIAPVKAYRLMTSSDAAAGSWLAPDLVADILGCYGITVSANRLATTAGQAILAAEELGWPVALKAVGPQLVHKSDRGGVALGLRDSRELRTAFATMRQRLGALMTGALVQPMAPAGIEMIVGVTSDPSFGPLVMCGLGGVWSDLLDDRAYRLTPLTELDAAEMVQGLKGYRLLQGYRGGPPADISALEKLILRIGRLADDVAKLDELDLNPVILHENGYSIVDAKLRCR